MTKKDLVTSLMTRLENTDLTKKEVEMVFDAVIDTFKTTLANEEKIQLVGFGTFAISERAARQGRNPITGETIQIAASKSVNFKAGKELKSLVNGK